jgi:hypothetical protein
MKVYSALRVSSTLLLSKYHSIPQHIIILLQLNILGMKAYKSISNSDDLRLFRPELNMKRLSNSMRRLSCPGYDFDQQELINCIAELVRTGWSTLYLIQLAVFVWIRNLLYI